MSRFWNPKIRELEPYVPGEQPKMDNLVKLNTNENPFGPSPRVLQAISAETNEQLRLYPDPEGVQLKKTIADYHGVQPSEVFLGNGSDEVLAHIFQSLFQPDQPLLFPSISYSFYPVYCRLYGLTTETLDLDDDFAIRPEDYQRPNGGVILPNPNAPTGRFLGLKDIRRIVEANPETVVVIDEAYVDFGGESSIPMVKEYPNLVVVQTLSKSRSLAGLRVGFAIANEALIEGLERVKNSFNSYPMDRLALAGAIASFEDEDYFQRCRQSVIGQRDKVTEGLESLGFEVVPSAANFVFTRHPDHSGAELARQLRERSIIVRHFNKPRIDNHLRITIGNSNQNQALLDALEDILKQG